MANMFLSLRSIHNQPHHRIQLLRGKPPASKPVHSTPRIIDTRHNDSQQQQPHGTHLQAKIPPRPENDPPPHRHHPLLQRPAPRLQHREPPPSRIASRPPSHQATKRQLAQALQKLANLQNVVERMEDAKLRSCVRFTTCTNRVSCSQTARKKVMEQKVEIRDSRADRKRVDDGCFDGQTHQELYK